MAPLVSHPVPRPESTSLQEVRTPVLGRREVENEVGRKHNRFKSPVVSRFHRRPKRPTTNRSLFPRRDVRTEFPTRRKHRVDPSARIGLGWYHRVDPRTLGDHLVRTQRPGDDPRSSVPPSEKFLIPASSPTTLLYHRWEGREETYRGDGQTGVPSGRGVFCRWRRTPLKSYLHERNFVVMNGLIRESSTVLHHPSKTTKEKI